MPHLLGKIDKYSIRNITAYSGGSLHWRRPGRGHRARPVGGGRSDRPYAKIPTNDSDDLCMGFHPNRTNHWPFSIPARRSFHSTIDAGPHAARGYAWACPTFRARASVDPGWSGNHWV